MKTIWKFRVSSASRQKIEMPKGAEILTVQTQAGEPMLWAIVDDDLEKEIRYFEFYGTGHPIPEIGQLKTRKYINTFQVSDGALVFHLFEIK